MMVAGAAAILAGVRPGHSQRGGMVVYEPVSFIQESPWPETLVGYALVGLWSAFCFVTLLWAIRGQNLSFRRTLAVILLVTVGWLAGLVVDFEQLLMTAITGPPRRYHYYYFDPVTSGHPLQAHILRGAIVALLLGGAAYIARLPEEP